MPEQKPESLRGLVAVFVALQVCVGLIAAGIYLSSHNTLYNNGNWTSTKTELAGGMMGSQNFVFNLQTLARGHLGMSAWFGYQEVISKQEFDPVRVEFDFLVKNRAHLTFEFNRTEGTFHGIRISASDQIPPVVVKATVEGEFVRKRAFPQLKKARDQKWHRLRVEFEDEKKFTVFLDGRKLKTFAMGVVRPQRIGFRGSLRPVYVDNLRVVSRDGTVFSDDFDRPANGLEVKVLMVSATLLLTGAVFLLLRRLLPLRQKHLLFYFLMSSVVLIVVGLLANGVAWHRKQFYPNASEKLRRREATYVDAGSEEMIRRIESSYTQEPAPGVVRLLFLGASQTRGSGAARPEHALVRRTESLLNERSGGTNRFECLNAAVRGYKIARMRKEFEERWVHWKPTIAILNAGNNDVGTGARAWAADFAAIVRASERAGIRLVVIPESNSAERPSDGLTRVQDLTRKLARDADVPVIEMHRHLSTRLDDGFLWWDWVHLTSFGHEAFARHLVDELAGLGLVVLEPAPVPNGS